MKEANREKNARIGKATPLKPSLTPREYITLLQSGSEVQKGKYDLSNLAGRLCRGKEPRHFGALGSGGTCFILGGDGLELFLEAASSKTGGAPLEMLLKIGYDILDIYDKLVEGWVFDLCVFERDDAAVHMHVADWDGVCEVLKKVFPIAGDAMQEHLEELKTSGCGVASSDNPASASNYFKLQEDYGRKEHGNASYSFAADACNPMTYERLVTLKETGSISVGAIRKFLFDRIYLNDLYGGQGKTRLADGEDGIAEYLGLSVNRSTIESLASTALGAPKLIECLQRISDMYEGLRMEREGGKQKHDLDRWLPPQEDTTSKAMLEIGQSAASMARERVALTPREYSNCLLLGAQSLSPLRHGQVLDGVGFRLSVGNCAINFCTLGGPKKWGREVVHIGSPWQLQKLLRVEESEHELLDILLDVGWSLLDVYHHVERGDSFRLVIVRWRPWDPAFPDSTYGKEQFPATVAGITAFCRTHGYAQVADALERHRGEVCKELTQHEHDEWGKPFVVDPSSKELFDRDRVMTYEKFEALDASAQDASAVRQFVFQTLNLRGGWNGSGFEKRFFDDSEKHGSTGGGIPIFIARNRDLTELHSDEFSVVQLGAPKMFDIVTRLKRGLEKLRTKVPTRRAAKRKR